MNKESLEYDKLNEEKNQESIELDRSCGQRESSKCEQVKTSGMNKKFPELDRSNGLGESIGFEYL